MTAFNESLLLHTGSNRTAGAPPVPPIVPASIFASWGEPDRARAYGRNGNPTWEALEEALGAIEDAEALVFSSGQAASMALMLALTEGRERLVMPADGYYNTRTLADRLRPNGVESVYVDQLDLSAVERELAAGASVLWAETPTNPLLRVADLARLGVLAAAAGAPMAVDNTVATGVLQQPLSCGAAASIYSLTKAASGHADVILGAVVTRDASLRERVLGWRDTAGGVAGPFEAWLALRGLRTLALRIRRQSESAHALARHLAGHRRVAAVHYPGLEPTTSSVVERQMPDGCGPLLSFEVAGAAATADAVVESSKLILPATSFGGVESTWERRARWSSETAPESLIRLSVGLERVEDLIVDIDSSLEVAWNE
jgi:cystathionine gamma-synthase